MTKQTVQYITREWYEKLVEELKKLKEEELPKVLETLKEAIGQWDISENAEYDAAMERKNQIEIRIAQLEEIIKKAKIIDERKKSTTVWYWSKVKFEDDKGRVYEVTIVGTSEVDVENNHFSLESPLGKALAGKKVWDTAVVRAPKWKYKVKILEVS